MDKRTASTAVEFHEIGTVSTTLRVVSPGGPADLAGMVACDCIELAATPFEKRRCVVGIGVGAPVGASIRVQFVHGDSA